MDDLISRQAAIDAVKAYLTDCQIEDADWHGNGIEYELESLPSAKEKPFKLPEIYVADGYDTVMGEDGNVGFGVYVPDEKQIYIAGDVDNEVRLKALFHELCHWAQDMCGRSFDEDEANEFSDIVYDALSSAQPEIIRCKECIRYHEPSCLMAYDGKEWAEDNGFCHAGERRTDG